MRLLRSANSKTDVHLSPISNLILWFQAQILVTVDICINPASYLNTYQVTLGTHKLSCVGATLNLFPDANNYGHVLVKYSYVCST